MLMTTYCCTSVDGAVDLPSDLGASGLGSCTVKSESELAETVDLETR
jgi:hypothetical protein